MSRSPMPQSRENRTAFRFPPGLAFRNAGADNLNDFADSGGRRLRTTRIGAIACQAGRPGYGGAVRTGRFAGLARRQGLTGRCQATSFAAAAAGARLDAIPSASARESGDRKLLPDRA